MTRLTHVIVGLDIGGAELMLYRLLPGLRERGFESNVVSLTRAGALAQAIRNLGVDVTSLEMERGLASLGSIPRLTDLLRSSEADIVQTWMYHADFLGGVAARRAGVPVVWGLHQSNLSPPATRRTTRALAQVNALLSRKLPASVICCSDAVMRAHRGIGYADDRLEVVYNGYDLNEFRPDPDARAEVRAEHSIPEGSFVVGLVARYSQVKDHFTFIRAAGSLARDLASAYFVLVGEGVDTNNEALMDELERNGVLDRTRLLGRRMDVARIYNSFDIEASSSSGEGLPNVIGEAMASGVPCVVTDVGDSARLVADTGMVVRSGAPDEMAAAWRWMYELGPDALAEMGRSARARIEQGFSLATAVEGYADTYKDVLARCVA